MYVIQRGNDRQPIFFMAEDYAHYRIWLIEAAAEYGCAVHAYVFMTNHVHNDRFKKKIAKALAPLRHVQRPKPKHSARQTPGKSTRTPN